MTYTIKFTSQFKKDVKKAKKQNKDIDFLLEYQYYHEELILMCIREGYLYLNGPRFFH